MYRNVVITSPIRDFQDANLGGLEYSTTWFEHIFEIGSQFVQFWQNRIQIRSRLTRELRKLVNVITWSF